MEYRPLGRTGLTVSEIGYGAWGIGGSAWIGAAEDESVAALRRAIELGVTFIDTARGYGESERIVGQVVRDHPDGEVLVATKVPPRNGTWPAPAGLHPDETFPGDHIRTQLETSLRESGLEAFDLVQLHVWSDEWTGQGDWRAAVDDLRSSGTIAHFGVSINDHQPSNAIRLIESGAADTVQVIYNVFDQSPEDELFPACREHGVGVIARVPLDEGGLTGTIGPDTEFSEGDFRSSYFRGDRKREVHERVRAIAGDLGIAEDELADVALRFVLSEPTVSAVIPGMRSVRNVERNVATSDGRGLPGDWRERLRAHRWVRDFYS